MPYPRKCFLFDERSRGSRSEVITRSCIRLQSELHRPFAPAGPAPCARRSRTTSDFEILRAVASPAISKKSGFGNFTVKVFMTANVIRFQQFSNTRSVQLESSALSVSFAARRTCCRPRDILRQTRTREKSSREQNCSSARLLNTKASQS